jgi:DNA-binding XRE family transcriptional regulator
MNENQYYAETIRVARNKARLTQAELAAALGVSLKTVWTWESGRAKPQLRHQRRLAELLAEFRLVGK